MVASKGQLGVAAAHLPHGQPRIAKASKVRESGRARRTASAALALPGDVYRDERWFREKAAAGSPMRGTAETGQSRHSFLSRVVAAER